MSYNSYTSPYGSHSYSSTMYSSHTSGAVKKVGLRNDGSSCYANCAIQVLYSCDSFRTKLLEGRPESGQKVTSKLRQLFAVLAKSEKSFADPRSFIQTALPSWFTPGRQQDCSEFMRHVLNTIGEEEHSRHGSFRSSQTGRKSTVDHLFTTTLTNTYTCQRCYASQGTPDKRLDLVLPFPSDEKQQYTTTTGASFHGAGSGVSGALKGWSLNSSGSSSTYNNSYDTKSLTVEDLLRDFQKEEHMRYYCERCYAETDSIRKTCITEYPPYLILILSRFKVSKYSSQPTKNMKAVDFPSELPISEGRTGRKSYKLKAVINHSGSTLHAGHYTCYAEHPDKRWYKFDDSRVSEESGIPSARDREFSYYSTPFVLVYTIKSLEPVPSLPADLKQIVEQNNISSSNMDSTARMMSMEEEMNMDDVYLQNIAENYWKDRKILAKYLNIDSHTVEYIEKRYTDPLKACYKMLCEWRDKKPRSTQLSVELQSVLEEMNKNLKITKESSPSRTNDAAGISGKGADYDINNMYLQEIAADIGEDWQYLAIYLGVSRYEIDSIERKNVDPKTAGYLMLCQWKKDTKYKTKAKQAEELQSALEKINKNLTSRKEKEVSNHSKSMTAVKCDDVHNDDQIRAIAENVGKHWKQLGVILNVKQLTLGSIETLYADKPKRACYNMLKGWRVETGYRIKEVPLNNALKQLTSEIEVSPEVQRDNQIPIRRTDIADVGVRSKIETNQADDDAKRIVSQFWDDPVKLTNAAEAYKLTNHPVVEQKLNEMLVYPETMQPGRAHRNNQSQRSFEQRMQQLHHNYEDVQRMVYNCHTLSELEKKAAMMDISDHTLVAKRKAELKRGRSTNIFV